MEQLIFSFSYLIIALNFVLICIFLFTKTKSFRNMVLRKKLAFWEKVKITLVFGSIAMIGTHSGVQTEYGSANIRAVAVIAAGLVGGPWVGIGAGLLAAIDRYFIGGISYLSSSGATLLEGFLAGLCYYRMKEIQSSWLFALLIGFLLEVLHMLILLLFSGPMEQAIILVQSVSWPMLLLNPVGIAAFIAIINNIHEEQERVEGKAAKMALEIAGKTLNYLRMGLNEKNAYEAAKTILSHVDTLDAVAITSLEKVLAFVGEGADHHSQAIATKNIFDMLSAKKYILLRNKEEIGCTYPDCPLYSKAVVPLKDRDTVVGSLIFYKSMEGAITPFEIELIQGLSQLISIQLEVSKVEQQESLLAAAEIKALQAQINPHFLFNALNTIVYYCRNQPEIARNLLIHLADFYRKNLSLSGEFVDFQTELNHIDSYVQIEMARFQGKLTIEYHFPEPIIAEIPPLILQPIVENAIKHGLYPKKSGGCVTLSGHKTSDKLIVTIEDNGVGIPEAKLNSLLNNDEEDKRVGLMNVHKRLQAIYGPEYGLSITSSEGIGTCVSLTFPA